MEEFLEGIYTIILNNDCTSCDIVFDAVMYHMLNMQNDLWRKAEERMGE